MGDDRKQPWVGSIGQQPAAPDTERTGNLTPVSQDASLTPVPEGRRNVGSTGTLAFSTIVLSDPAARVAPQESEPDTEAQPGPFHQPPRHQPPQPETLRRDPTRPEPARELDMQVVPHPVRRVVHPQNGGDPTLQSMMRPDLSPGISDPRRFLSIERELSEDSAAIKFLEKRLNRLEKDHRVALAIAALALLLAVVALIL